MSLLTAGALIGAKPHGTIRTLSLAALFLEIPPLS